MDTKETISKNYYDAYMLLKQELSTREFDLDKKHYVIVPEKYSLYSEQLLFDNGNGAFDVEILSFSRLFLKFAKGEEESLQKSGAVMLIKKIAQDNKKNLLAFGRSTEFVGFSEKIYETLETMAISNVDTEELCDSGATGAKFNDIALIYKEYKKLTSGKYIDSIGKMQLLLNAIESIDTSNCSFYIIGFDSFNAIERKIIKAMATHGKRLYEYSVLPPTNKYGDVEFYDAPDIFTQLKAVATRIRDGVINGKRYKDYCIVSSSVDSNHAERILSEFDIPFFVDKKHKITESELFRFITLCYDCEYGGMKRQDVIMLAKNYYAGIDCEEVELFENYVNSYSVTYKGFFNAFERGDISLVAVAENVRAKVVGIIRYFESSAKAVKSGSDFNNFIINLCDKVDAQIKTVELSNIAKNDLSQIYDNILSTASLVEKMAIGESRFKSLFDIFVEGLNSSKISLLPELDDVVIIGLPQAFRIRKFDTIFAVDFTDGALPEVLSDTDLITDTEAKNSASLGQSYGPTVANLNERAKVELQHLLACGKHIFLGYSESNGSRISYMADDIKGGASGVVFNSYIKTTSFINDSESYCKALESKDIDYSDKIAQQVSSFGNALELYVTSLSSVKNGFFPLPFVAELREIIGEDRAKVFDKTGSLPPIYLPKAGEAFFASPSITVSKIQDYFKCPYSSFLSKSLSLVESDDGEINALDVGNFLHRAIEIFVNKGEFDNPRESMKRIVKSIAKENYKFLLENNEPMYCRISSEAEVLSSIVARSFTAGDFDNFGVEMKFGHSKDNSLATIHFDVDGKKIALRGTVDRADIIGDFVRVIDYKTGAKSGAKFDFDNYYYGKNIQLGIYMRIMEENGYECGGMFYFPLSARWDDNERSHLLSGVYNSEEEILVAFDKGLTQFEAVSNIIDARRNKKPSSEGMPVLKKNASAQSTADISRIALYSTMVMEKALHEIANGYITASPFDGVCEYCKYKNICHFDKKTMQVRKSKKVSVEDIIDVVETRK